ncbi:hypothetical protein U0070_008466 [Myodes glareolus]|uniref:Uncharacterized protein n=1 Tax=Myodes glareolus TaxID=447135 RepID=A0AAW0I5E9_MYOGA
MLETYWNLTSIGNNGTNGKTTILKNIVKVLGHLEGISSVTVDSGHVSIMDVERSMVLLSLSEQIKDV